MNQPAIELKMPESEQKQVRAKLYEVIFLTISRYEKQTNNAHHQTVKLVNSIMQDIEQFIDENEPGPL